jgi:hypothetical protein
LGNTLGFSKQDGGKAYQTEKDVVNILSFLTEPSCGKAKYASAVRIVKYPSLMLKLEALISTYQALRISRTYGW